MVQATRSAVKKGSVQVFCSEAQEAVRMTTCRSNASKREPRWYGRRSKCAGSDALDRCYHHKPGQVGEDVEVQQIWSTPYKWTA